MNILFAHDHVLIKNSDVEYFSVGGLGGENFFNKYITDPTNDKVYLYCRYQENKKKLKLKKINSENVICIPSNIYKKPIDYFTKYRKIVNEVNLDNIDACVVRIPSVLGSIVWHKAKKMGIPTFVEMVACPWDAISNYGGIKGKLFAPVMYFTTKNIIKKSKYVHYVSKSFLQRRYPNDNNTLACSDVVIENIDDSNLIKRIEKINKFNNRKYIIGIVGSLNVNYKGHEVSIKALSLLKDKIDFELHCLGSGNKEKWQRLADKYLIGDRIFFDGVLPSGAPVMEWLDNLDLHLIISKQEGLPRILVEAMSRGCISIGSNVGGIPELLDKDWIVEKNNYKKLADSIIKIYDDKELQVKTATRNFKEAKKYLFKDLSKKRKKFYDSFIKNEVKKKL